MSPRHLERLLELDLLLRSGFRQTAKTLAEALEVSERTIHSDLDFLHLVRRTNRALHPGAALAPDAGT